MNVFLSPGFYIFNGIGFILFMLSNAYPEFKFDLSIVSIFLIIIIVIAFFIVKRARELIIRNDRYEDILAVAGSGLLWIAALWIVNDDNGTLYSPPALTIYLAVVLLVASLFPILSIFRKS